MSSIRHDAIFEIYPNVATVCDSDGVLDADGNQVEVDEEQINLKISEIEARQKLVEYKFKREMEYPSIQECIHAILDNDLEGLQLKRAEVKAKYPKPT
jgi:hypothetical protein